MTKGKWKPRHYTSQPRIGQHVMLAAISTRDMWHEARHKLLWNEYIVLSVKSAKRDLDYAYEGWYNLKLQMINPSNEVKKIKVGINNNHSINISNQLVIATCQVKILGNATSEQNIKADIVIAKREKINTMLEDMNMELNSKEEDGKILVRNDDKEMWELLRKRGFVVQYKNTLNHRPQWRSVKNRYPFLPGKGTIIFRIKPTFDMYFKEKYRVEEILS